MPINQIKFAFLSLAVSAFFSITGRAEIQVDPSDREFFRLVEGELSALRDGERGLACRVLVERMEAAQALTQIRPLTRDDSTWHPNDRKGLRSHVVPQDVKVRGSARTSPTDAVLYVHPSRVNPRLSAYKLGTFVHELAEAADLNLGAFSGDYRIRERRATFFRNAWRDSFGTPLLEISGGVPTTDYQWAKDLGLLDPGNADLFPILNPDSEEEEKSIDE